MQLTTLSRDLPIADVTLQPATTIDLERIAAPHLRQFRLNGDVALLGWVFTAQEIVVMVCQEADHHEQLAAFVLSFALYASLGNDLNPLISVADPPSPLVHNPVLTEQERQAPLFDKGVQDGALLDAWTRRHAPFDLHVIDVTGSSPTLPIFALLPPAFCFHPDDWRSEQEVAR